MFKVEILMDDFLTKKIKLRRFKNWKWSIITEIVTVFWDNIKKKNENAHKNWEFSF